MALCERPAFGVFSICGGLVAADFSMPLVFIEAVLVVMLSWQLILLGLLLLDCRWLLLVYSIRAQWRFQGGFFSGDLFFSALGLSSFLLCFFILVLFDSWLPTCHVG